MKSEEGTFYPQLLVKKGAREDAMEGIEEHHVAEMVLKELEKMPKGEDQWGAKMSAFKELVEHHIKEEEGAIFKSAEQALSQDEFEKIMKQFEQEERKIRKDLKWPRRQGKLTVMYAVFSGHQICQAASSVIDYCSKTALIFRQNA